jgi:ribosomal protein S18 acetylase RimI-like enzyme
MGFRVRPMKSGEEDAVAVLIRQMPKDIGLEVVPLITGQNLRECKDVAQVTVIEDTGQMLGVCLWTMTYSSWRAGRGIYISDLYVMPFARGKKVGEKLLVGTIREAQKQGAVFIKMEVDKTNDGAARFYERLGFIHKSDDRIFILEPDAFASLAKGEA